MKNLFVIGLMIIGAQNVLAEDPAVHATPETAVRIHASCKSDEFAILESKNEKMSSESAYVISVKCVPAVCLVVNNGGKISVHRLAKVSLGTVGAVGMPATQVMEALASGISGSKETAMAEAQKAVSQGLCKTTNYVYSNSLINLINSL